MATPKDKVVQDVKKMVAAYFSERDKDPQNRPRYKVPLMSRLYGEEEVAEVVDTLLTPESVTLNASGELKTEKFENLWAAFIRVKKGIMVNSGSSANLVALYMLNNPTVKNRLVPGDEVITNSLTWGTSVSPLYALGLRPVLVDSNLNDYGMDVDQIEKAITPKTKAILVVHLLGFPADMERIMKIAKEKNLLVIEDCCEAHGAEWNGSKVGGFGHVSTFSFYLSHHITTLEGGMVMTNDDDLAELARIIRSQGVMRNVKSKEYKDRVNSTAPDIDPRFLFANTGYNFRPTEMEGAFGMVQFKKFDAYMKAREKNAEFFTKGLSRFPDLRLPVVKGGAKPAWFGYSIMLKETSKVNVSELKAFLEKSGIETRPIMSGDYTRHPVAKLFGSRVVGDLTNTRLIHKNAFFIGVHAGIGEAERNHVVACFEEFFGKKQ